ncbi:hypothetical protein DYI37_13420 [Fulvimarina endophytica]|uniref:Uncharacterized protein n=1 Tax=Fulvimarina endophytica TaxID=2293836 RepID=A0A371X151_9HYPH|nr:hypothetical protein [Fulvimarina endophytica]RFC62946.1 hypothetical protein DYI37_13420 [Fulvimarina endophytica]
MITVALTFAFGLLLALLAALLLAPLVWKRARSIARQEFEATIPANAREIQGTYDRLRAQTAFDAQRREIAAQERESRAAAERANAGRVTGENAELRAENKALSLQIGQLASEIEDLNEALSRRESEADAADSELRDIHQDMQLRNEEFEEVLARYEEVSDLADQQRVQLVTLETRNQELTDALRTLERRIERADEIIARLSGDETAAVGGTLLDTASHRQDGEPLRSLKTGSDGTAYPFAPGADEKARPGASGASSAPLPAASLATLTDGPSLEAISDPAALREEIAEIAALVIDMTARQEGRTSPIESILASAHESDERSLAGRVRALRKARETESGARSSVN